LKRLGDFALSERSNSRNKGDSDQRADSTTVNSLRSFASWKFDVLDALAAGLDAREFQVAYCLLQFANNTTRAICPAQAVVPLSLKLSKSGGKGGGHNMLTMAATRRSICALLPSKWVARSSPDVTLPSQGTTKSLQQMTPSSQNVINPSKPMMSTSARED
jgi:hypothetical protein